MRIKHILVAAGALATVAAAPAMGVGNGVGLSERADTRITITGFVPVICHTRVSDPMVATKPGGQSLGELREFCNNPRGYQVVADYSPSLNHSKIFVDGKPVPLGPQGSVVISRSNHAQIETRKLELVPTKKALSGTISFRIEPL